MTEANVRKLAAEHTHPGPWKYIQIAVILAVITAVEVVLYYIKGLPKPLLVLFLFALSALKFGMVALYFMHLKFDAPVFKRLFLIGIILAFVVYTIVLLTFGLLR